MRLNRKSHQGAGQVGLRIALGAIVKNEGPYIAEWALYHQMMGFDPIIVYNNESADETTDVCMFLQDRRIIKHVRWPQPDREETESVQLLAYRHIVRHVSADWICFLDADEFLCLEHHNSVQDFIATHTGRSPIGLNWKVYGSSDRLRRDTGPVIDRFRMRPRDHEANVLVKTMAPLEICYNNHAHVHIHGWPLVGDERHYVDALGRPLRLEGNSYARPPLWKGAWINHYLIKSLEEFKTKSLRGRADATGADAAPFKTIENYFNPYDRNEVYDFCSEKYVAAIKWRLEAINSAMRFSEVV